MDTDRFFDRLDLGLATLAADRPRWHLLFVGLLALILFLPGFFSVPPIDRDEARFAQASRQMVASGDLIDIRLGEDTRYKKPVGIYWLQSAARALVGPDHDQQIWVYRLPSLVAAVGAVLLTYLIALSLANAQAALLAAVLMASCFVLGGEARVAKTDAALLASILAAQLALARLWMGQRALPWLFWGALAASVLLKGPIGVMVVGLTLLALIVIRRGVGWLAPLRWGRGLLLFLAIVLPWYVLITLKSGAAFWDEALGRDLLAKIGEGQESHGAPFGTYALAVWATFWPASILLPFGLWFAWVARREAAVLFCLAWILPSWLVFELTATKLIHYVLPTYPALAVLCAMGWAQRGDDRLGLGYRIFLGAALVFALVLAGVSAGMGIYGGYWPGLYWLLGLVITGGGIWATWVSVRRLDRLAPVLGLSLLTLGLTISLFSHLARFDYMWPSPQLAAMVRDAGCADGPLISVGYEEPSLLFVAPRLPRFTSAADAVARAKAADCAIVLVEAREQAAFDAALGQQAPSVLGTITGFNLGKSRDVAITGYGFGG